MTAIADVLNEELLDALYSNAKKTTPTPSGNTLSLRNRRDTVNRALEPIDANPLDFLDDTDGYEEPLSDDLSLNQDVENDDVNEYLDEDESYEPQDDNLEVENFAEDEEDEFLDEDSGEYLEEADYAEKQDAQTDTEESNEEEYYQFDDDDSEEDNEEQSADVLEDVSVDNVQPTDTNTEQPATTEENLIDVTAINSHYLQATYEGKAGVTQKRDSIVLYKTKCLRCSYLCSGLPVEKFFDPCHVSNGNLDCPAGTIRIIPNGVNTQLAATGLAEAQYTGDIARQHKITGRLLKLDSILVKHIIQLATAKLKSFQSGG